jgi:tetratricopeptide (TPR) repeat protein
VRVLVIVLALVLGAGPALADNRAAAREAFTEGTRHYDLGRYSEALASFMRAYMSFEDPAILFNIAQCQRQLGNKAEAVKFYRTFLRKVPDAPNAEDVRRLIATMEAALGEERKTAAQPPQGTLETETRPSPAPPLAITSPPPPAAKASPLWKRWWVWTVAGVGVAAVVGIGLGVGLSEGRTEPSFMAVTLR